MSERKVVLEREEGVAHVWIERPDVHNAFDDDVVSGLTDAIAQASGDATVRVIVLGGRGKSFSAGADLGWMKRAAGYTREENVADAQGLARMLRALRTSPKATIARVQGAALGGGLGLVAACDVAIAASRATFGFSEVKLGLIPAVISPHVIEKIGPGRARELFVTGERFDAARARELGLVAQVVDSEAELDVAVADVIAHVLANAPDAVAAAKALVDGVEARRHQGPEAVDAFTAEQIALRRASPEAAEGIAAFLEKRPPSWRPG